MVRFEDIVIAYFVIGAVMWGGGAISWGDTGVVGVFIDDPGGPDSQVQPNQQTSEQLQRSGGPVQEAMQQIGGSGLLAAWNVVAGVIGFFAWPIGALVTVNAPPRIVVLFGGVPTVGFFGGLVRLYIAGD